MELQDRFGNAYLPATHFARFVVDPEKCNACARCVQTCPGQILEMREEIPVEKKFSETGAPLGCIACSNCESVCPEEAIEIQDQYRVEEGFYKTLQGERSLPNPFCEEAAPPFESIQGDLTEVERVIYRRRSNRLFLKRKEVPEKTIRRILEAGRFAPSGGNCQPWRFTVITDRDLLDRIDEECRKRLKMLPGLYLPKNGRPEPLRKAAINLLARLAPNFFDQRVIAGSNTVASNEDYDIFLGAPAVILVLGDKRGIGEPELDCGLAAHNMVLTAHALGLGTCYVGFAKLIEMVPALKEELEIHWPYAFVTSIALGFPSTRIDKAVSRERAHVTWFPADRSGPREES